MLLLLILLVSSLAIAQYTVRGKVTAKQNGSDLVGVSVKIRAGAIGTSSDEKGEFTLTVPGNSPCVLIVSHVGFLSQEHTVSAGDKEELAVELAEDERQLQEVLVSTGYQQIPKERATGSFSTVDNQLLNRRVGTNVIDRIEDVVPGLSFVRGGVGVANNTLSIRGQSTIFANAQPLIIIDNFAYDGDPQAINPNDVESITVLKDAAAASIWGARAGNGVIVITTKKGRFKQARQISFNSNITVGMKPDLFYQPQMSSADYIALERRLFDQGYYKSLETSPSKIGLSPVVELLIARRDGTISAQLAEQQITALTGLDSRDDLSRYFNRNSVNQQYAVSIRGGENSHRYNLSGGFDRNLASTVGNVFQRITLNGSNTYAFFNKKLELTTSLYYTSTRDRQNGSAAPVQYPYQQLAATDAEPLTVTRDLRDGFKTKAESLGLLNWGYRPLEELNIADHVIGSINYRLNTGLNYKLAAGINVQLMYQYAKIITTDRNHQSVESYYARDLINRYTSIDQNGTLIRRIPLGAILDMAQNESSTSNVRAQLNFDKDWKQIHSVTGIAGSELMSAHLTGNSYRLYGYNPEYATSQAVDYLTQYPRYNNQETTVTIPNLDGLSDMSDRYVSYYANAAYSYKRRYTVSASTRFDMSNLFGVKTNQKGVPLYSFGASWNLSDEKFYRFESLPYLKLRTTFGFNGNIDKTLSAYTTASYNGQNTLTGLPYASIVNPPNPQLRWERVRVINIGVDFESKKQTIGGSIEVFFKNGMDLIGTTPFVASSGITRFKGNTANTSGKGLELILNTRPVDRTFKWYSTFLFSYIHDKVTDYNTKFTSTTAHLQFSGNVPTEGKPLYGIYSYRWAGLEPSTGDPLGYLEGEPSSDYTGILNATTLEKLIYHGSARPVIFGAFRNTLSWKQLSLSFNISYRLKYFFRQSSVQYGNNLGLLSGHGDYANRWKQPGDETSTHIPSEPKMTSVNRDSFYAYSEVLVERGDHIRLRDFRLALDCNDRLTKKLSVGSIQLFIYANNLGILWKATSSGWDPDYVTALNSLAKLMPPARTLSVGLTVNF